MKQNVLGLLACPHCVGALSLSSPTPEVSEVMDGTVTCADCARTYPIEGGVPRFVPRDNYSTNFGMQWKKFRRTQLDSFTGISVSRDRFYAQSRWQPAELAGKRVLDIGCGAGRFTEVVLAAGAEVIALDYSEAVEACFENHSGKPNFNVVQGDIYHLPFKPGIFDFVFCFGVLQHTPDTYAAFFALPKQLKPGGKLAVDFYRRRWFSVFEPKYVLRPLFSAMRNDELLSLAQRWVPRLLPLGMAIEKIPGVGRLLLKLFPIAVRAKGVAKNREHAEELSILDTFDWYGPAHDNPQTLRGLEEWLREAGLDRIEVDQPGHLAGRGRKPVTS